MKLYRHGFVALCVMSAAALSGCLGARSEITAPAPEPTVAVEEAAEIVTMYVGPTMVDCVGVAPMRCLQVKYEPGEPYQNFYDRIDGFAFEEGFEYRIVVEKSPVPNAPADASAYRYRLLQQVSKTPVASTPGAAAAPTLEGTSWSLVSLLDGLGKTVDALPDAPVTAMFLESNVAGSAGCNNYNAPYTLDGEKIAIQPAATTRMMCEEPVMSQETAYLAALVSAATYQIQGESLMLVDARGATVATYAASVEATSAGGGLTGTTWQWTGSEYSNDTSTTVDDPSKYTLEFADDGRVTAKADCNTATGTYTSSEGQVSIRLAATTLAVCPEGSLSEKYIGELGDVVTYVMTDDGKLVLNLKIDGGNMYFAPAGR